MDGVEWNKKWKNRFRVHNITNLNAKDNNNTGAIVGVPVQ